MPSEYPQSQTQSDSDFSANSEEPTKKKKILKATKKIDLERNIFPNAGKRTGKMILLDYKQLTEKYLRKWGLNMQRFLFYYPEILTSNYSGSSFSAFFPSLTGGERDKYTKFFSFIYEKILRKRYLLVELRTGKMTDMKSYIKVKNSQLMYFSDHMKLSQMR